MSRSRQTRAGRRYRRGEPRRDANGLRGALTRFQRIVRERLRLNVCKAKSGSDLLADQSRKADRGYVQVPVGISNHVVNAYRDLDQLSQHRQRMSHCAGMRIAPSLAKARKMRTASRLAWSTEATISASRLASRSRPRIGPWSRSHLQAIELMQ